MGTATYYALILVTLAAAQSPDDLPDFSRAGYHSGEQDLPVRKATIGILDLGALPDPKGDLTGALRKAVEMASKDRGVVGIPPGRWLLTHPIEIQTSGVVLQGAGSEKTILVCPRSLTEILGPNRNWSWSGGMVRIGPSRGPSSEIARVKEAAPAGSDRLVLELLQPAAPPRAGEWLELRWFNDTGKDTLLDHLYGGLVPRERMGRELQESGSARVKEWVQVGSVQGEVIRIAQPLRIDARPEWRPTLVRRPYIEEVGVSGISFEFPGTPYPGHLKEKGFNGIEMSSAIHCWVRDVRMVDADSGIFVGSSRYVTVEDVTLEGREMHHGLSLSWSSDCLVTRWRIEAPHVHGTTLSWAAHGNVFSRGSGKDLAMDCHRAAPFENLHTAIVIEHGKRPRSPFKSGGKGDRGPHSARGNVYWNIEHRFEGGKGPFEVRGQEEWPRGIFVGWHGNRPLRFEPTEGLRQQVLALNQRPAIVDLHTHQE